MLQSNLRNHADPEGVRKPSISAVISRRDCLTGISVIPLLGSCSLFAKQWSYNFKFEVSLALDGLVHSTQSIVSVKRVKGSWGIGGTSRGDAAVLGLPDGRKLFALLRCPNVSAWTNDVTHLAFKNELPLETPDSNDLERIVNMVGRRAQLSPKHYPYFAVFDDLNIPASVNVAIAESVATIAGSGARIISVWLEITDQRPVMDIEKFIPWISAYESMNLDGTQSKKSHEWANVLDGQDFRRNWT